MPRIDGMGTGVVVDLTKTGANGGVTHGGGVTVGHSDADLYSTASGGQTGLDVRTIADARRRSPINKKKTSDWSALPLRWNGVSLVRDVPNIEAYAREQYANFPILAPSSAVYIGELKDRGWLTPDGNPFLAGVMAEVIDCFPHYPRGYDPVVAQTQLSENAQTLMAVYSDTVRTVRPGFGPRVGAADGADGLRWALEAYLHGRAGPRGGVVERTDVEGQLGGFGRELLNSFTDRICDELCVARFGSTFMDRFPPGYAPTEAEAEAMLRRVALVGKLLAQSPTEPKKAIAFLRQCRTQYPEILSELETEIAAIESGSRAVKKFPRAKDTGLQRLLRHARLPLVPRFSTAPPSFEEIEVTRKTSPRVLEAMLAAADFRDTMPLIDVAIDMMPDGMLEGVQAVCVQHGLATQWPVFRGLAGKGLKPENTQIISPPYSGSALVQEKFRRSGYDMQTALADEPDGALERLDEMLLASLGQALDRSRGDNPILVLDDGGHASRLIHQHFPHQEQRFRIVEQTTRGQRIVEKLGDVGFVCSSVATCPLKPYESNQVAYDSFRNINRSLDGMGMPSAWGQPVTIVGYGVIGRGLARIARGYDCPVAVWDEDPDVRARARADGFFCPEKPADEHQVFEGRYLVLGATGNPALDARRVGMMDHETVMGSVSSGVAEIEDLGKQPDVESMTLSCSAPGDSRYVNRLWRMADKDIVVLRNRFPVTFNGDLETGDYEAYEQTRAAMVLGIVDAFSHDDPRLRIVGHRLIAQYAVACGKAGLGLALPKTFTQELRDEYGVRTAD